MLESQTSGLKTPHNLISPLPSPAPQTISTEINTATRAVHARLNKLIIARLPLALPPHSDNPELFAHGINAFAQIYFAFESRWSELLAQGTSGELLHSRHDADIQRFLIDLVPPGLWRTDAIKSDLQHLSKALHIDLDGADGSGPRHTELTKHIQKITTAKPHTLIAYSWIMYMAIFSGGRWIRQQLLQAGPAFWHVSEKMEKPEFGSARHPVPGFSLFYFESEKDGEDIKADFKARLAMAEELLSEQERREVCEEAEIVFDMCVKLVEKLDEELATPVKVDGADIAVAYAQVKAAHVVSGARSRHTGPLTALLAVLLACLTWYGWSWTGTQVSTGMLA